MAAKISDLSPQEIANYYAQLFAAQDVVSLSIRSLRRRKLEPLDRDELNEIRPQLAWLKLQDQMLTKKQYDFERSSVAIEPPTKTQVDEIQVLAKQVAELQSQQRLYRDAVVLAIQALKAYNDSQSTNGAPGPGGVPAAPA